MTYTSFFFFIFLLALAGLYFLLPLRWRWIALLAGSVAFYLINALSAFPYLLAEALIAYGGALLIRKKAAEDQKQTSRRLLLVVLIVIIGFLAVVKLVRFIRPDSGFIMPLGLSYYTFSTVGYVLDIYWKRYEPETNFLHFLLYVSFFPHILQGPIPRFDRLGHQLFEGHRFEYRRVCFGIQLMLFGLFQKMVLADRLGIYVDAVFGNYQEQYGLPVIAAIFFYAIQIYTDFAGCVNIARGVSEIFGVYLEDNFRQPYFSTSVEEFWRRWHMTLGGFFRDYVGMPVSVSKRVKSWSKAVRKKKGAEAGRHVVSLSALAVVWLCTGLWHGTGVNYLLWALWQGGIIAIATVNKTRFQNMKAALSIPDNSRLWHAFQVLRTFLLAGIIPRIITRAPSVYAAAVMVKHSFSPLHISQLTTNAGLKPYGWNLWHLGIAIAAMLIQLTVSLLKEHGVSIREKIAGFILPARWAIYLAALFIVVLFGIYGPGYDAGNFVYMDF